uniref:Leucine-rich repeat-containing N-terminal plant-type domain-containing protein n=1 Tax=Solanum lycopersicum TaxID=4081 RepID=A0A3Q7E7Q7_SOLLC
MKENLWILDLSNNSLSGTIDTTFSIGNSFRVISLHGNKLTGKVPPSLINCTYLILLDLGNNQLNDTFPNWLGDLPDLQVLSLRSNKLHGPIKSSGNNICNLKTLEVLDLRSNNLEGTIPHCMGEMSAVKILDLSNNGLSGTINTTFSIGNTFNIIKLDGNKLQGKVPPSLINCEKLEFLDLSNNELNDTFPKWLGGLRNLKILNLRSNKLYGPIRTDNFFAQIRVIDISSNGFSGDLPVSLFQNFQAMKTNVTTKGLDRVIPRILITQILIDLSRNRFEGHIPSIIGDLVGLRTLNLSHNVLEGHIPASLQNLSVLESLDLSSNKLDGEIPQQLVSLTSLEVLNLSHNHLVGCIPKGKQFDTFENNSYLGNDGLRGLPPSRDCGPVLMGYGCGLVIGLSEGCKIGTHNYYENEKAQEKILVSSYLQDSKTSEFQVAGDADKSLLIFHSL